MLIDNRMSSLIHFPTHSSQLEPSYQLHALQAKTLHREPIHCCNHYSNNKENNSIIVIKIIKHHQASSSTLSSFTTHCERTGVVTCSCYFNLIRLSLPYCTWHSSGPISSAFGSGRACTQNKLIWAMVGGA